MTRESKPGTRQMEVKVSILAPDPDDAEFITGRISGGPFPLLELDAVGPGEILRSGAIPLAEETFAKVKAAAQAVIADYREWAASVDASFQRRRKAAEKKRASMRKGSQTGSQKQTRRKNCP